MEDPHESCMRTAGAQTGTGRAGRQRRHARWVLAASRLQRPTRAERCRIRQLRLRRQAGQLAAARHRAVGRAQGPGGRLAGARDGQRCS